MLPKNPGVDEFDALQRDPDRWIGAVAALGAGWPCPVMTQLPGTPRSCVWPHLSQRDLCHGRQQRTGLPAHLLAQLGSFVQNPVPSGPNVALIGEFTPFNLRHQDSGLSAMFDFGDGLVGPREHDWLGPLCCLAAGDTTRIDAFFDGYLGRPFNRGLRQDLLRLLLLHRYSHLKAQIAVPAWQTAPDLAALATLIWP